jgi:hypothetical protein
MISQAERIMNVTRGEPHRSDHADQTDRTDHADQTDRTDHADQA